MDLTVVVFVVGGWWLGVVGGGGGVCRGTESKKVVRNMAAATAQNRRGKDRERLDEPHLISHK